MQVFNDYWLYQDLSSTLNAAELARLPAFAVKALWKFNLSGEVSSQVRGSKTKASILGIFLLNTCQSDLEWNEWSCPDDGIWSSCGQVWHWAKAHHLGVEQQEDLVQINSHGQCQYCWATSDWISCKNYLAKDFNYRTFESSQCSASQIISIYSDGQSLRTWKQIHFFFRT